MFGSDQRLNHWATESMLMRSEIVTCPCCILGKSLQARRGMTRNPPHRAQQDTKHSRAKFGASRAPPHPTPPTTTATTTTTTGALNPQLDCSATSVTAVGFEPTPLRTGALSQRLRPLGQTVLNYGLLARIRQNTQAQLRKPTNCHRRAN